MTQTVPANPTQPPIPNLLDIELPDPVTLWPPAPGWWLVAAAGCTLLLWAALKLRAYWRHNAYRRAAKAAALAAWRDYESDRDGARYARALNRLLKRTALAAYRRPLVAKLSGEAWANFLASTAGSQTPSAAMLAFLRSAPYRTATDPANTAELNEIHRLALGWIKHHRPTAEFPYA
ncbi:DUF4381 domain-containing protein [Exilibacterium tricleocarpae]|uniref:DUF4381 domain-containing protein n=1 Tax=Exilibacterium tricleocarpae TaxID=2591008 RepID=A0A545TUU0_9GAMM|nr:DUF4381 domain-containing protein [Exilibacterium tricleocarpae]TQV80995.1 DUF4381 domain-containing protein [Exilibacterium tricleocarpae]